MTPEDRRGPSASYRVATSVPLILLAFAVTLWAGATVDVLFQPLFSWGAIAVTALSIRRSASLYPSATALPLCVLLMLESEVLATQFVARTLHYAPTLGEPIWRLAGMPLYSPFEWSSWVRQLGPEAAPLTFAGGMALAYGGLFLALLLAVDVSAALRLDRQRAAALAQ